MLMTTSRPNSSPTSSALAAPSATRGSQAAAERFHTVTSSPACTRRVAMAAPMPPRPRNPTFIRFTPRGVL
ncbi:Uncharacterised protein [Acinetobacter baumannii]|nr:Uncharacterised protein [Acinetobacter baumannii]